jgi:uncharacterized protein YgiM (DUF1202 family)
MKLLNLILVVFLLTAGAAAQSVSCEISVYVIDKDPNGLNVRSGAGKNFDVLGQIMPDEDGVIIDVIASNGSWMQIENPQTVSGITAFEGDGWVFASLLATTTRMKTKLYSQPNLKSKSLATLGGEEEYKLVACTCKWAKIQVGKKQGWLAPDAQCGNPVTTCP